MLDLLIRGMVLEMVSRNIPLDAAVRHFRRAYVLAAVRESAGNKANAARRLKVHRNTVNRAVSEAIDGL